MNTRTDRLVAILDTRFRPGNLAVVDESAQHAGHAGASPGGETHYAITMMSEAFAGLSRVARSRLVHEAISAEFAVGLHAVSLTLRAPGETF